MADIKALLEQYENPFTLDDTLKVHPAVTEARVKRAQELMRKARRSRATEGQLVELFTTSNLGHSIAHLLNIQTIPQLPAELKDVDQIAGSRVAKDFNPVVLRSLLASGRDDRESNLDGAGIGQHGEAAVVPEGTPYPLVTFTGNEEAFYQRLGKRGFRFDFTFESVINDLLGELDDLPTEMLKVAVDTVYAEVYDALFLANQYLPQVELVDGTTVPVNAPLSARGIIGATIALENRTINGRKIGSINSVNVIIPKGRKRALEYDLSQFGRIKEILLQDGSTTTVLSPDADIQALLPHYNIIESDRVTGTEWFLLPKAGSTPRPVLERLSLRGYENPEIRVRGDQGYAVGGRKLDLFDGGFDADTMSYRFRLFGGAALWDATWIVRSKGTGQA